MSCLNVIALYNQQHVERLLRERELRRSRSSGMFTESSKDDINTYDRSQQGRSYRLLVVANRLPVSAVRSTDGSWLLKDSVSGLVAGLRGAQRNYEVVWVGWPGVYVDNDEDKTTLTEALVTKSYRPVFLDENTVDLYYNG